ncbi:hypothetical protein PybrP1_007131 [[Pythium] brassicae (nom. inval.)]|nr:hypothetical protein PybrP1_007131 [[Pythium] brassicae (nom. inval.)]
MSRSKRAGAAARQVFGDERTVVGVDDLVLLSAVSESAILENLKMRHAADVIYAYIGHVLVVVNPYKWLDIYDEASMRAYTHKARIDVPPHVFATAEEAYRSMLSEEDNQCVIISGESGAGKTEASKQIQNYIAGVSGSGAGVDKLQLDRADRFEYLRASGCYAVDDVDDAAEFEDTMAAMQHVGIKRKQIELVLQTVAAVLHLGNVQFESQGVGDAEGARVRDRQPLETACELLGLSAERLEHALCYKLLQTMAPGGKVESYEVPQNPSQAQAQRDSLAKAVYDRLFDFLVERINHALDRPAPGLFLVLDDTVRTMHSRQGDAVDATFLEKAASLHGAHAHFSKRGRTFEIKHYAGDVQYSVDGFGDANRDFLSKDIALIVGESANKLVRYIFPEEVDLTDKRIPHTAGYRIRTQCEALVAALMDCTPHYVRCIKSNDQKQPNKLDDRRVVHQIKYLGLLENVKVRRAGYAYRGDYGRFVDRFRLLSKETYPAFRGSDKKGAQAILRSAAKALLQLEREVQFGKSMVFIQTPETFFALEKLREHRIGSFAARIQKAWKRYHGRRHLLQLSHDITKLYAANSKQRQRVSIYRPFDAVYLRDDAVHDAVMAIIRHYGDSEKIVFLDAVEKACPAAASTLTAAGTTNGGPAADAAPLTLQERVLVITDSFLYLMEKRHWRPAVVDPKSTFEPPLVYLRRRLPLGAVEEISMSTLADPYLVLRVRQEPLAAEPDRSHWVDDKQAVVCMATGKKFGLFNRRHHCRYTGRIYCSDVCRMLEPVPDRGFYSPVRVYDKVIGLFSTELPEDQLLASEKKTEIAVTLVDAIRAATKAVIPITFSDSVRLRTAPNAALSRSPTQQLQFVAAAHDAITGDRLNVQLLVASGVPDEYIRKRRKREKARRKKLERQREEELALRAQRQAAREREREAERVRRVAEKKAKKQAEKDARRQAGAPRRTSSKGAMDQARKFGEAAQGPSAGAAALNGPQFGGANNELAAALARRRGDK